MLFSRSREGQEGQALVLFTLVLVVILLAASIVVDLGMLRNNRQTLVNALDSGALAGGTQLPVTGPAAKTTTNNLIAATVQADYPGIPSSAYTITYRCLIGADPATGQPLYTQITAGVCNPTNTLGHAPGPSHPGDFTGSGQTRSSACDPTTGDTCNVVLVVGATTTNYGLANVVGISKGSTGQVVSAACNGPCGASPVVPTDLVIIIDRTASMSDTDVAATRSAAQAVLQVYNPAFERVGLGFLGPSSTTTASPASGSGQTACVAGATTKVYTKALTSSSGYGTGIPTNVSSWIPIGLSGTDSGSPGPTWNEAYSTGSSSPYTLTSPSTSHLVNAINCFDNPGGTGTNLATPLLMAKSILDQDTRAHVIKGILLETDGQPSYGVGSQADYTCSQANTNATTVKNAGILVFTVGFGLDGGNDATCPDNSGTFRGKTATYLLASMASPQNNGSPSPDLGCPTPSNALTQYPGDKAFCETKSSSGNALLQSVFQYIAINLAAGGLHLVQLYPTPVVTAVSSGGAPVMITGEFLTGATGVSFGGTPARSFTVNSDTSITATPPGGTSGTTVDVIVSTPGGSSPIVSGDHYRYP